MSNILDSVKNLREVTGAGFLDCKKALVENNNDIEASIDFLRKKGLKQHLAYSGASFLPVRLSGFECERSQGSLGATEKTPGQIQTLHDPPPYTAPE